LISLFRLVVRLRTICWTIRLVPRALARFVNRLQNCHSHSQSRRREHQDLRQGTSC
jgi:hypothetical protein